MSVLILIHTHSEYSFLWPVLVGEMEKYNKDCEVHFLTDSTTHHEMIQKMIPPSWILHFYHPSATWTDRLMSALVDLNSEYVLFLHDDWIPVGHVSKSRLEEVAAFMSAKDIKCMLAYHNFGCNLDCSHTMLPTKKKEFADTKDPIYKYQNEPHHILQPALWDRCTFIRYTIKCNKTKHQSEDLESLIFWSHENCWSVQNMETQYTIRTMNSYFFPHIHAVCEGKWNLTKYPTLKPLLESYGLETESRGDHSWWELDTQ